MGRVGGQSTARLPSGAPAQPPPAHPHPPSPHTPHTRTHSVSMLALYDTLAAPRLLACRSIWSSRRYRACPKGSRRPTCVPWHPLTSPLSSVTPLSVGTGAGAGAGGRCGRVACQANRGQSSHACSAPTNYTAAAPANHTAEGTCAQCQWPAGVRAAALAAGVRAGGVRAAGVRAAGSSMHMRRPPTRQSTRLTSDGRHRQRKSE